MRKVIIHTEQISKPLEKLSFQVKIPKGAIELTRIYVSAIASVATLNTDPFPNETSGDLVLSIPNKREHFYTESIRVTDTQVDRLSWFQSFGISAFNDKWIQGTMDNFFGITVEGKNTLIEGFYESRAQWNYQLKIYLEFDV